MLRNKFILFLGILFLICVTGIFAQEKTTTRKSKRDPFMPLVMPDGRLLKLENGEEEQAVSLEGIMYDKSGLSYALINGSVVRIGDIVDEFQVFKILEDRVIFLKEGQPIEVKLKKEE